MRISLKIIYKYWTITFILTKLCPFILLPSSIELHLTKDHWSRKIKSKIRFKSKCLSRPHRLPACLDIRTKTFFLRKGRKYISVKQAHNAPEYVRLDFKMWGYFRLILLKQWELANSFSERSWNLVEREKFESLIRAEFVRAEHRQPRASDRSKKIRFPRFLGYLGKIFTSKNSKYLVEQRTILKFAIFEKKN